MNIAWFKTPILFETIALVGLTMVALLRGKPAVRTMPKAFYHWFLLVLRSPWIAFLLTGLPAFMSGFVRQTNFHGTWCLIGESA